MTYTGLELFMEKLKQLIYNNDYPLISNHLPSVSPIRPLLRWLYEELHSMIQMLFTEDENRLHEPEEFKHLKIRIKDVAEEAHERIDLFVSLINFDGSVDFGHPLHLRDIIKSIKSIKKELDSMKTDSYPQTRSPAPEGASSARSSFGSNKRWDENVVGLDHDARLIIDKLVEDKKGLDVVSIVGTGGIGKTTLATKVFNDSFVVYHFHIRAWVTVSQTYEKRDLLIQILASIGIEVDPGKAVYSKLREMLHKCLMGNRFLIVIDDIWETKAWDDLKVFFPNNQTGSRILLTSRLKEVALHAKPYGFIHQLEYLTDEESWELLRKKVFHGHDCPESLFTPGIRIAKSCHGLPLALVVIAGVLAKEATNQHSWERIARNVASYVFKDPNRYIETLALSVYHLPLHLRDCFLYLGGFPEDYEFKATRLIWLWIAEGFVQEPGGQSLEKIAESYLMELVDRNLVVVRSRKSNGAIKTFSVHDVLRELCFEIKENFFLSNHRSDHFMEDTFEIQRIFRDRFFVIVNATRIRSLLYFETYGFITYQAIRKCFSSWMLLIVLDLQQSHLSYFPVQIACLIHLRYLAIWFSAEDLPFTICNLRCLQTLVIKRDSTKPLLLPSAISMLVNLRHLRSGGIINLPPIKKPMNLQSISNIATFGDGPKSWAKYFPHLKKLSCFINPHKKYDFKPFTSLEILNISLTALGGMPRFQMKSIMFPDSLKTLTLKECHLPWTCMSKIQSLPKLEVLKLLRDAFVGPYWGAGEEPFQRLKFLKFKELDIVMWDASSIDFPCLKQLVIQKCWNLVEIPLETGYISTLERIEVGMCQRSVERSVVRIQTEQHVDGNFDIEIIVEEVHSYLYRFLIDENFRLKEFFKSMSVSYDFQRERKFSIKSNLALYLPEAFRVLINRPVLSPAGHHTRNNRIWNDQRSKHYRIRRKFSNRDGRFRLLRY